MRKLCLTAIFILCSLFVYPQNEKTLQELHFENTSLPEVLKKIEQLFQTSILFVYDDVEGYYITTQVQVATVDEAVKHILHDKPFYYKKGKDFISVSQVQNPVAELTISGCVVDTACVPLPAAYVELVHLPDKKMIVSGVTDDQGRFKLACKSNNEMQLIAKYMGFRTTTVYLKNLTYNLEIGYVSLKDTTVMMDNVQITSKGEIEKSDRRIVFPSAALRKKSSDGLDLLSRMSQPEFDPIIMKSCGLSDDVLTAEIRINGRSASLYQVKALNPNDVIRVEYIYASSGNDKKNTIVNMITRQSAQWNTVADMMIAYPWASNTINLHGQFTHLRGEWGINYSLQQERFENKEQETLHLFSLTPGKTIRQQIKGVGGKQTFEEHHIALHGRYSFTENSEIVLNAGHKLYYKPWEDDYHKVNISQGESYDSYTHNNEKTNQSDADLNYVVQLSDNQKIKVKLDGFYQHSIAAKQYTETQQNDLKHLFAYDYNYVKQLFQAKASVYYIKEWSKTAFTAGGKYAQQRASLNYNHDLTASFQQRVTQAELFLDYRKTWQKVSGNGYLTAIKQYLDAGSMGKSYYTIAPQCNLNYLFAPKWALRYCFTSQVQLPDITQHNNFILPVDRWRRIKGDANLSPTRHYEHAVHLKWTPQRWNIAIGMMYHISRNPLAQYTQILTRENASYLCYQMENGKKRTEISPSASVVYQLIPDYLNIKLKYNYHYTQTHGSGYICTLYDSRWSASVYGTAGCWTYGAHWGNPRRQLQGQLITQQQDNNKIYLGYRYKALNIGLDWVHPFAHRGVSTVLTRMGDKEYTKNKFTIKEYGNRINLSLSWNIGKQVKGFVPGILKSK